MSELLKTFSLYNSAYELKVMLVFYTFVAWRNVSSVRKTIKFFLLKKSSQENVPVVVNPELLNLCNDNTSL